VKISEEKERKRVKERGKRVKETQRGALATRNPMLRFEPPGEPLSRSEERTLTVLPCHAPPRSTRSDPLPGPVGFVCAPDE
jgi:hypothetical protein